jgi:hypothetical protein
VNVTTSTSLGPGTPAGFFVTLRISEWGKIEV